jgi:hopene-associated glycosyltransferase HpnB
MVVLSCLAVIALLIWLGILLHPACPWDFHPVGDDGELPPLPQTWPTVCILVPARNESESLPRTLPTLLQQDYPGDFSVVVVDDRSHDGTAEVARKIAERTCTRHRLTVFSGADLPPGWVGKVWALEQGAVHCGLHVTDYGLWWREGLSTQRGKPQYFLLTDADICHAPGSLRRLVAESENAGLALNSRMARLRCVSGPERLLIPPFVFFFNLLYPMRQVNERGSTVAAAAGGCILLASSALEHIGGFACIRDNIIDDVNLARQIKGRFSPIQLSLSRHEVKSLRAYASLAVIWAMVRRTAFTELRYSWLRLAGTLVGLGLMFLFPLVGTIGGVSMLLAGLAGWLTLTVPWVSLLTLASFLAWGIMTMAYQPAVRFFGLPSVWVWTLPLAGILYGLMTLDSAVRYVTGMRIGWRDDH